MVVKVFCDSDNYVALNREHAMICACLNQITNVRKGSPYGIMRTWDPTLTLNFGYMLLYFALRQCITERPPEINVNEI